MYESLLFHFILFYSILYICIYCTFSLSLFLLLSISLFFSSNGRKVEVEVEFTVWEEGPHFPPSLLWIPRDTLPRFAAHENSNFRLMTEVLLLAIVQVADILEVGKRHDSSRVHLCHFHPTSNHDFESRSKFRNRFLYLQSMFFNISQIFSHFMLNYYCYKNACTHYLPLKYINACEKKNLPFFINYLIY